MENEDNMKVIFFILGLLSGVVITVIICACCCNKAKKRKAVKDEYPYAIEIGTPDNIDNSTVNVMQMSTNGKKS